MNDEKKLQQEDVLESVTSGDYKYGFYTDVETETLPKGLNEDIVRRISQIKGEPAWMLDRRLRAFRHWQTLTMPDWAYLKIPPIDFQDIIYYAAPKKKAASLEEVDPEILNTFDKLGIPLKEREICKDHLSRDVGGERDHLLFNERSHSELPHAHTKILGGSSARQRQLFRCLKCCGVQRWEFLLHPERSTLSNGA